MTCRHHPPGSYAAGRGHIQGFAGRKRFAEKNALPCLRLSAIQADDVRQEEKRCGKRAMGVVRTTDGIAAGGTIVRPRKRSARTRTPGRSWIFWPENNRAGLAEGRADGLQ